MKKFEELNFYEVLEVPFNASDFEIRQAYKEALSIYSEESLVTYSFFTDEERAPILKKIEEAFLTLIDDRKRGQYDKFLVDTGKVESGHLNNKGEKRSIPLFPVNKSRNKDVFLKRIKKKLLEADPTDLSEQILSRELISGKDLRTLRKAIGIDLEEVFEVTRISMPILDAIERDLVEKLPPVVYLKNFLRSYAQVLQIDPEKVSEGYIKNMSLSGEGIG